MKTMKKKKRNEINIEEKLIKKKKRKIIRNLYFWIVLPYTQDNCMKFH